MFKKVLVANRGDVAVRVMRACRELGVETVAIYSEADRNALHVRYANEAYPVGEGPARSSYLDISRIVDVAIRSDADAIHPGYGFLAEHPLFPLACMEGGITFIGPDSKTIRMLRNRLWMREHLQKAEIPVLPMTKESLDPDDLRPAAEQLGFPLLVRPVAGGGGLGERLVVSSEELEDLLATATREAASSFGMGEVYLEKSVPGARRVEVHVLADNSGQIICLGESEGTIRRRHQKLIEESPAPAMPPALREEMSRVACDVAQMVGLVGIGTVEFWVDHAGQYYYLNMNPRLWVGHPALEMVTGIDLVKEQIRIASGRHLRYTQGDIVPRGHAVECRIHAEDPYDGFRPSVGQITRLMESGGPGTRVETGIYEGFEVSHYYDPLMVKLVAWGERRGEAILRMRRALDEYRVVGVKTNIPFLQQIMNRTSFIGGRFDASQEDTYFTAVKGSRDELFEASAIAAVLLAHQKRIEGTDAFKALRKPSPWKVAGRWEEMVNEI
jgi:acetyl-CoA carboxylase biotin carboxylase subunit